MDNNDKINELEIELDYETQTRLYWENEAKYWHRKYQQLATASYWHNLSCNKVIKSVKKWKEPNE